MSLDFILKVTEYLERMGMNKTRGREAIEVTQARILVMMTGRNRQIQKLLQRQNQMDLVKMVGNKDEERRCRE